MDAAALDLPAAPSLAQILDFEDRLRDCPQISFRVRHHFSEGIYLREMILPAGAALTGKMHRHAHLNILAEGEITVWTEQGMKRLKAPCIIPSQPECKRAGLTHAPTTWITVHHNPDNLRDPQKLEALYTYPESHALETKPQENISCHS